MTPHLHETELVDMLDGILAADRVRHVDTCETCGGKLQELRTTLSALGERESVEPSPLFWDHFSAGVRAAVAAEPAPSSVWRLMPPLRALRWAGVAAFAAIVLAVGLWRSGPREVPPRVAVEHAASNGGSEYLFEELDTDEAWAVVRTVTDDLREDEITDAGLGPRPGSAERAAHALSESERVQLADLIEREIKAGGASVPSS